MAPVTTDTPESRPAPTASTSCRRAVPRAAQSLRSRDCPGPQPTRWEPRQPAPEGGTLQGSGRLCPWKPEWDCLHPRLPTSPCTPACTVPSLCVSSHLTTGFGHNFSGPELLNAIRHHSGSELCVGTWPRSSQRAGSHGHERPVCSGTRRRSMLLIQGTPGAVGAPLLGGLCSPRAIVSNLLG